MNTINELKSYTYRRNNPQPTQPQTTTTQTTFRGALGDNLLREVSTRQTIPTVENIMTKIKSTFGLSSDKTKDVLESCLNKIKQLLTENISLKNNKLDLENKLSQLKASKDALIDEAHTLLDNANSRINAKDTEIDSLHAKIREQNSKISELEKYATMAFVKPVNNNEIIMPEQFFTVIDELNKNNQAALDSTFDFIMNGKGQEEALKQLERCSIINKALFDNITNIPEVREKYNSISKPNYLDYDLGKTIRLMIKKSIMNNEDANLLNYPDLLRQAQINAAALAKPFESNSHNNYSTVFQIFGEALNYRNKLFNAKQKLITEKGYSFEGKHIHPKNQEPYYRFKDKDGNTIDHMFNDLANGFLGFARITTPEGKVCNIAKHWL